MKETPIEQMLRLARKSQPDLWARTDAIARIIDPAAFADGWICSDGDTEALMHSRNKLMQSTAICKAQAILRYLGVNTDADWYDIFDGMSRELPAAARKRRRSSKR